MNLPLCQLILDRVFACATPGSRLRALLVAKGLFKATAPVPPLSVPMAQSGSGDPGQEDGQTS